MPCMIKKGESFLTTVPSKDKSCRDLLFSFVNSTHKARFFVRRGSVLLPPLPRKKKKSNEFV